MRVSPLLIAASLVLAGASPSFAQQWAAEMFEVTAHDFGSVARGAKAEFDFKLTNPFLDDVEIGSAKTSCGCTSVEVQKSVLKTYESGSIRAKFNTHLFLGKRGATITVTFVRPRRAVVRLKVGGTIHNDLIVSPSSADLGTVEKGTPAERTISVRYAGRQRLEIVDVKTANPHLKAKIVSPKDARRATYELVVQLDDEAPSGYIRDNLLLVTTHRQMKQIPVMVEARVLPEITVSPPTLFLGVLKPGQKVTRKIVVQGKRPFSIKSITADREGVELPTPGEAQPSRIHVVPITIVASGEPGALVHKFTIETDAFGETPELSSYAVVEP